MRELRGRVFNAALDRIDELGLVQDCCYPIACADERTIKLASATLSIPRS